MIVSRCVGRSIQSPSSSSSRCCCQRFRYRGFIEVKSKKQKKSKCQKNEKKLQSNSHIFSFSLFPLVRESLPLLCPAIQSEVMWKSPSHLVAKLFYSSSLYLYSSVYPFLFLFSTLSNSLSLSLFLSMSLLSCSKYIRYYQTFLTPHR